MNPISGMLAAATAFKSVVPMLFSTGSHLVQNLPDVEKQASALVTGLEKIAGDFKHVDFNSAAADIGQAWKAGQQIFADAGISHQVVNDVVTKLPNIPAVGSIGSIIGFGEDIAKQLGL